MANSIAALARWDYIAPLPVAIVREPGGIREGVLKFGVI